MAEHPLYRFDVRPGGDRETCGRVAKVMDREFLRNTGALLRVYEPAFALIRSALMGEAVAEDERPAGLPGAEFFERLDQELREWNASALVALFRLCFRLVRLQLVAHHGEDSADVRSAGPAGD